VRYDQPGHGSSGVPASGDLSSTTFETLADDAHALLAHLGITRLFAWIGVSMGAATGIVFAAKYPGIITHFIPCDTISGSGTNLGTADVFAPRVAAARQAGTMEPTINATLERWFGNEWMTNNPQETERMRTLMMTTTLDGFELCCEALRSASFDLRPLAEKAGQGVDSALLLVGSKDANLPQTMEELRAGIEKGLQS
jgi:3-oxoadipate enol-lactonase